ncbi:MAG: cytidine deaminase [Candidatus Eisenbacteria bacterium]|nr:cytidine deaminase [Candidatus Eisenbacteria bacterium]
MLGVRAHQGACGGNPTVTDGELVGIAAEVRKKAYAPYSGFAVGAALLARDGRVFTGVNVENASIGLSVCAERNAIAKALSEGARDFDALAISTGADEPTMPCGVCRQVMWEFSRDLRVIVQSASGARVTTTIAELFPRPFTSYLPERS